MAYGGGVLIEMGINSARMTADIGKITSMMQQGAKKIESAFQNIGATIISAIGVGSLGAMATAAIETAHEIELMSQKFGIAAGTLSSYMASAKIAGLDTESIGKGLKFLAKNATDAAKDFGTNTELFKKMGIDVKDASGHLKPMSDLLDEVRGKFRTYAEGPEMAALALKLFGREGVQMIPWLTMSKEKLEEIDKTARAFGATMSDEGTASVAGLADGLHLLEFAGKGLANQFVEGISPALRQVIDDLVEWAIQTDAVTIAANVLVTVIKALTAAAYTFVLAFRIVGSAIAGMLLATGEWAIGVAKMLAFDFSGAEESWAAGREAWKAMLDQMADDTDKYNKSILLAGLGEDQTPVGHPSSHTPTPAKKKTAPRFTDEEKAAKELARALKQIAEEALRSQEHLEKLFVKSDEDATTFARKGLLGVELELTKLDDEFYKFMIHQLTAWEAGAITSADYTGKMKMASDITERLKNEVIRLNQAEIDRNVNAQAHADWTHSMAEEIGKFGEATGLAEMTLADYNNAVSIAINKYGNWEQAIRLLRDGLAEQNQKVQDAADSVSLWNKAWSYANTTTKGYINQIGEVTLKAFSSMEDALTTFVMTGKANFKDFANSVIADLVRIAIRASITAPLAGGLSSLWSGFGGGGGTTSIAGSGFTGTIGGATTFPAMASGGPVLRGSPYLVGEQGPELFVPSSSGSIVPHAGSGNVSVNIRNESGQPVAATTAKASFDSQGWVVDVVLDAVNRNVHGLRTALGGT